MKVFPSVRFLLVLFGAQKWSCLTVLGLEICLFGLYYPLPFLDLVLYSNSCLKLKKNTQLINLFVWFRMGCSRARFASEISIISTNA